ncbi:MAG: LptF/LptG family permease [Muribaculaceae bacterium]|nr:LptF/LptG family permease [Muribaculaceae bacterium]
MLNIKRLHIFLLKQFVPLLVMTFFISLFIVMMQFLWRYIDDLVGKGLGVDVIGELFFYAALTMVPTALPLAVLLASLMTFGNLGEKLELTALKAAGISLMRIMKPLTILMILIAIGAFFFQNNVLPIAQTKMYTLLFSMRQKSPEVEIPVKSFYDQIPGMNLYIDSKDRKTGTMYGMIIYDVTRGIDDSRVILADSGKLAFTEDKTRLFLHLYKGEMFENFRDNSLGTGQVSHLPFRRETFDDKQIYFAFDANFNRIDEGGIRSQYVGKNIAELSHAIDSIQLKVDSIGTALGTEMKTTSYLNVPYYTTKYINHRPVQVPRPRVNIAKALNVDSIFYNQDPQDSRAYINQALTKIKRHQQEYQFKGSILLDQEKNMRRHEIEMQKKFTLSIACLIFFFIGAPLGAIVKKGGIGMPLVLSVLLFIVYFIFDNAGYKLARDGRMIVWVGMWLSTMVMAPLGMLFTYMAVGDRSIFDLEIYRKVRTLLWPEKRKTTFKEVRMEEVESSTAIEYINKLVADMTKWAEDMKALKKSSIVYRFKMIIPPVLPPELNNQYEMVINYLSNTRDKYIIELINELQFSPRLHRVKNTIQTINKIKALIENKSEKDADISSASEDIEHQHDNSDKHNIIDKITNDSPNE